MDCRLRLWVGLFEFGFEGHSAIQIRNQSFKEEEEEEVDREVFGDSIGGNRLRGG